MVEDAELLRRYTDADSEPAFAEFVGRHINLVYFAALRGTGGDTELAQEVAQAVFTLAARRARTLMVHATVTGWLYTTTRHVAARTMRKARTRQRYEREAAMHAVITGGLEHDWTQLRPVIDDALAELGTRECEAILFRFFEDRPFADLGATWRVSADAARMRVDRAVEKLRDALERRGIRSISTALATVLAAQGGIGAPVGMAATVSGAALSSAAASGGLTTFFAFMSGTKITIGTAAAIAVLATGTAVLQWQRAETAEIRLESTQRELATVRSRLTQAEQKRSTAESRAAEVEKDNDTLLAAVEAAQARPRASGKAGSSPASPPNDPLARELDRLFPNGIVATVGDRRITADEVRRQIASQLPQLEQLAESPEAQRQRLYALQNSAVANLVTRQLDITEFNNQPDGEAPKHIAAEVIDNVIAGRVKANFANDQANFLASLNAQGMTLAQYRQSVEEDIIYSYMRNQQRRLTTSKDEPVNTPSP